MIEGRKITQVTKTFMRLPDGTISSSVIEQEHRVTKYRRYLEAGPLPGGGVRQRDMIQFYSDPGGLRTVHPEDLVL